MIWKIMILISLMISPIVHAAGEDKTDSDSNTIMDLYYTAGSSPCRSVLLTAKLLGIEMNLINVNMLKREHLKPDFVKLNPQHQLPTLVDNGFTIGDSHAINMYLIDKYGKDDSLYPRDLQKRAVVNQRLFFDAVPLYQSFAEAYYPLMRVGTLYTKEQIKKIDEAFELLDKFLQEYEYVAGDQLTIADLSILASVTTIEAVEYDINHYRNVDRWLKKLKSSIPDYEETNGKGVEVFHKFYLSKLEEKNTPP